jgi:hypothetical protein
MTSCLARGATENVTLPSGPAAVVKGGVIDAACSWREVEVVSIDDTPPRS